MPFKKILQAGLLKIQQRLCTLLQSRQEIHPGRKFPLLLPIIFCTIGEENPLL